jgi:hypothetical protein
VAEGKGVNRTVSDNTSLLRLLSEGRYVAYGSYAYSDKENVRYPLESFFTLSHTELLLVLDGSFSLPSGVKHDFKLELELPRNDAGKGYFVFQFAPLTQVIGVLGHVDGGIYMLSGRSKTPPTQLSCHLVLVDDRNVLLQGLLAYEDFQWVTWSLSMKTYDPQKANESVVSLSRRA